MTKPDKIAYALRVKPKPLNQIALILTGTQPELEEMFAEQARRHSD